MEIKKDIGKAFREKLDNLDRMPNDALWDTISKDLDNKKKRKFPLFWFSIFSLLATVCIVFILTHFNPDNNATDTKQDNHQNDKPAYNPVATDIENPSENKSTSKYAEASHETNHQTEANERIVTHRADKNAASSTAKKYNNTAKNSRRHDNTGQVIGSAAPSSNGRDKNNAAAQKNSKQNTQYPEIIADRNAKKTGSKSKKHPIAAYSSKAATTIESDKGTTKSGYSANTSKSNSQKTATQSQITEQTADSESGKQTGNASAKTVTTPSDVTGSEIVSPEGMSLTTHDSLPENILAVKDSLKTEVPKEEIAEEKEETKKDSLPPVIVKRLSVFAFGGPSYFNFPDRTIKTDSTTSKISTSNTFSYGVLLGYRINSKLSIHTGVSLYKLKQSASNIKLNYVMGGGDAIHPELIPTADFNWIDYKQPFGTNSGQIINRLGENYQAIINIDRELSYVQIPLEIGYTVIDKKFGFDVFSGGSLLFLTKNEVFAYNQKGTVLLGKWNEVAKTSFTGTLGLGLNYKITPSLQINAEPMFNYYFNTYNNSKPYSLNIRLGLQYNFDLWEKKK